MANGTDQVLEDRLQKELKPDQITSPEIDEINNQRKRFAETRDRLNDPNVRGDDTLLIGIAEGLGRNDIANDLRQPQSPEAIASAQNQLLQETFRQEGGLGPRELEARRGFLLGRQEEFGRELLQQQPQLDAAIDQRLSAILQDAGFRADAGRQQVGAALSGRGLIRGTAGSRSVGAVTAAEQAAQGTARLESQALKQRGEDRVSGTFKDIRTGRRKLEQAASLQEIRSLEDVVFAFNKADLDRDFQRELESLQLGENQRAQTGAILTGALTAIGIVAGTFAGNPVAGGMAGAAAGSAITS